MKMFELFARDPREHTDEEVIQLIAEMRELRAKFVTGGQRSPVKTLTTEQKQLKRLDISVDL